MLGLAVAGGARAEGAGHDLPSAQRSHGLVSPFPQGLALGSLGAAFSHALLGLGPFQLSEGAARVASFVTFCVTRIAVSSGSKQAPREPEGAPKPTQNGPFVAFVAPFRRLGEASRRHASLKGCHRARVSARRPPHIGGRWRRERTQTARPWPRSPALSSLECGKMCPAAAPPGPGTALRGAG